jgi:hypothetical protein
MRYIIFTVVKFQISLEVGGYHEDGGSMFLQNTEIHLPVSVTS